jgi:hypothetical protein
MRAATKRASERRRQTDTEEEKTQEIRKLVIRT